MRPELLQFLVVPSSSSATTTRSNKRKMTLSPLSPLTAFAPPPLHLHTHTHTHTHPKTLALSPAVAAASPAAHPPTKPQESTLKKFLVSGTVAWIYEFGIGHFLEFIKISKQTKTGSYFTLTKDIIGQKGIVGVWDGFFPWGTVQAIAKGAVFGGAHAFALGQLMPLVDEGKMNNMLAQTLAGGIGGGFQGLVLSPTLLLKTRVMTDPIFRENMTMWETSKQSARVGMKVIKNEGVAALMKGSITFSLKRVADWGTRFYFAVMTEEHVFKKGDPTYKLTNSDNLIASLVGGTLSSLLTLPLDVMVAQIQQASKAGQKVSILQTFQAEFKAGGWERVCGFATKGFVARTLHVALTTALMKTLTSVVYDLIYGGEEVKEKVV